MKSQTAFKKKWGGTPRRTILRKTYGLMILFFICTMTGFIACNNDKKQEEKPEKVQAASLATVKYWPYFKLDTTDIRAVADSALFGKKKKSVILEHLFNGVSGDSVFVKLLGFPSINHAAHGRLSNFFEIPEAFKYDTLKYDTLILGNNYLDWDAISQIIFVKTGPDKFKKFDPDFAYILFEPMNTYDPAQHLNCNMCAGHLWYKITIYKKDGSIYTMMGGGSSGSTNPSPPADPTN